MAFVEWPCGVASLLAGNDKDDNVASVGEVDHKANFTADLHNSSFHRSSVIRIIRW